MRAKKPIRLTDLRQIEGAVETLLFVTDQPLSPSRIGEIIEAEAEVVEAVLVHLGERLRREGRGFQLREVGGGWRLFSNPSFAQYVERLIVATNYRRLTRAALETLAIIAYKQPITKGEIGAIRGVGAEATVNSLVEKGLIREAGRVDAVGQPILYATTTRFIEAMGMRSISELPALSGFHADEETKESIIKRLMSETDSGPGGTSRAST